MIFSVTKVTMYASMVTLPSLCSASNNPQLRYSLTLCEEEKAFVDDRRRKVYQVMKGMLGDDAPANENEVRRNLHHRIMLGLHLQLKNFKYGNGI